MPIDINYFNLIKLDATSSTNSLLKEMVSKKQLTGPSVVWARHQTKGRGQGQNSWISEANKNLTLSIYTPLADFLAKDAFLLSAGIALEIVQLLAESGVAHLQLKWPNDILSCGKKIGGLLFENNMAGAQLRAILFGVGININQTEFLGLPKATSIKSVSGKSIAVTDFGEQLLLRMAQFLSQQETWNTKTWLKEYNAQLFGVEEELEFSTSKTRFKAILKGVNSSGEIVLEREGEILAYTTGQIKMHY